MPRGYRCRNFQVLCCPFAGCPKSFQSDSGCTNHVRSIHPRANRHRVLPVAPLADIQVPPSPTLSHSSPQLPNINPWEGSPVPPSIHQSPDPPPTRAAPERRTYHPFLNGTFFRFTFSCLLTLIYSRLPLWRRWPLSSNWNPTTASPYSCSWGLVPIWRQSPIQSHRLPFPPGINVSRKH